MEEEMLQFAWETRSFHARGWHTLSGEPIEVVHPGTLNRNQGPDFLYAHVKIQGVDHFGHIEIHVDGRDWYRHGHEKDPNYNPVVLHVVLQPSLRPILRQDGTEISEGSLEGRLLPGLEAGRQSLMRGRGPLACKELLASLPQSVWIPWIELRGKARLEEKIAHIAVRLENPRVDWEQALWELLAGAMGGPVNKMAFKTLAERLPLRLLRKYSGEALQREALLFGMAGALLGAPKDDYHAALKLEWDFLAALHSLSPSLEGMRMHRMRPSSFPNFRLSQLGALVTAFPSWVQLLEPDAMRNFLSQPISSAKYWKSHLHFGRRSSQGKRNMGPAYKRVLLLNSLCPMGVLYARAHGRADLEAGILRLMHELPSEKNRITNHFERAGLAAQNAWQGQAQLHLYQKHCLEKRCMSCAVGRWIVGAKEKVCLSLPP